MLTNKPPCADLITEKTFGDFKLHVELMYPAKSNSGVYLRGRYEAQIQDDFGKSVDSHRIGGIYGFLAPYVNAAKPAGEWQAYDITLIGRRVTIVLNGQTIIDNEIIPGHHRRRARQQRGRARPRSCCRGIMGRSRSATSR